MSESTNDEKSFDENRHDQLTSAPKATEEDAAPRFDVSEHDGVTRIDVRDDAAVRPGPGQGDPAAEKDTPITEQ